MLVPYVVVDAYDVVVVILITVAGFSRLEDKTSWCTEHKGLMVRTIDGWKCIHAEALK